MPAILHLATLNLNVECLLCAIFSSPIQQVNSTCTELFLIFLKKKKT